MLVSLDKARPTMTSIAFKVPEITGQETWRIVLRLTSSTREFRVLASIFMAIPLLNYFSSEYLFDFLPFRAIAFYSYGGGVIHISQLLHGISWPIRRSRQLSNSNHLICYPFYYPILSPQTAIVRREG
jgi:hypothetical protein